MDKQIVFAGKNKAELWEVESQSLREDCVRVKTCVSTISNGTEKANLTRDTDLGVFSKPEDVVPFPRKLGYSASGVVVEKGSAVKGLEVGDRVAMYGSTHRSYNVIPAEYAIKIEYDNVSYEEASLSYIASFPLAAIRKARIEVGESAMVMGLGILGLLGVACLHAAGAVPVIAVDPDEKRREQALKFGADYAFSPYDEGYIQKIKEITGSGVNVAIEVTGLGVGLNQTLECMAKYGRVSLLGCTRSTDFSVDYYRQVHGKGVSLIGASTVARPSRESSPGLFTTRDDIKTFLKLCALERINAKGMIGETHTPEECSEVYQRLLSGKDFPSIVQYDWRDVK